MASPKDSPATERTKKRLFKNPFLFNRATIPAYRVRLREKRVLWLVGIAFTLAGLGALLGARLLSRPRQIRTTVKADLQVLDARLWETVRCLGGPGARPDGSDLPALILRRSLRHRRWPTQVVTCRQASAQLLSATAGIIASASGAPARLSDEIRTRYRAVLTAASRLHLAVSAVADDALAGHRVPAWSRCLETGQAVGRFQETLSSVERSAAIHHPRSPPKGTPAPPPTWARPARLSPSLPPRGSLRFVRSHWPHAAAIIIADPDRVDEPPWLLLAPFDEARLVSLRSPLSPRPAGLRYLDLVTSSATALAPNVYWAYPTFDARTGRGSVVAATSGPTGKRALIRWPRNRWVSARPVAGISRGNLRLLLLSSPRGLWAELNLFVSTDSGRTYRRPVSIATDALLGGGVRLARTARKGGLLLIYAMAGGTTAVVPIHLNKPAPAMPGGRGMTPGHRSSGGLSGRASQERAVFGIPTHGRALVQTGDWLEPPRVCDSGKGRLYLLGNNGQLWTSGDGGKTFRAASDPTPPGHRVASMACLGGRVALVLKAQPRRYLYRTCGPETCTSPVIVSWSHVYRVQLFTDGLAVVALAAGPRCLFARRDPGASGRLGRPSGVTRWGRPPRDWLLVHGPDSRQKAILLLSDSLRRLRTSDGGRSWRGE